MGNEEKHGKEKANLTSTSTTILQPGFISVAKGVPACVPIISGASIKEVEEKESTKIDPVSTPWLFRNTLTNFFVGEKPNITKMLGQK